MLEHAAAELARQEAEALLVAETDKLRLEIEFASEAERVEIIAAAHVAYEEAHALFEYVILYLMSF